MKLKVAGILLVLSGVLIIFSLARVSWSIYRAAFLPVPSNPMPESMAWALITVLGIPGIVSGALTLLGGVCALRGRSWGLAFTGSIFSLLVPPLGLPSGILLVLARNDWSRAKRGFVIGILSLSSFFVVCFWVLAQLL